MNINKTKLQPIKYKVMIQEPMHLNKFLAALFENEAWCKIVLIQMT